MSSRGSPDRVVETGVLERGAAADVWPVLWEDGRAGGGDRYGNVAPYMLPTLTPNVPEDDPEILLELSIAYLSLDSPQLPRDLVALPMLRPDPLAAAVREESGLSLHLQVCSKRRQGAIAARTGFASGNIQWPETKEKMACKLPVQGDVAGVSAFFRRCFFARAWILAWDSDLGLGLEELVDWGGVGTEDGLIPGDSVMAGLERTFCKIALQPSHSGTYSGCDRSSRVAGQASAPRRGFYLYVRTRLLGGHEYRARWHSLARLERKQDGRLREFDN
ncbi:unnamed protein product [Diplocarpon coronariae]